MQACLDSTCVACRCTTRKTTLTGPHRPSQALSPPPPHTTTAAEHLPCASAPDESILIVAALPRLLQRLQRGSHRAKRFPAFQRLRARPFPTGRICQRRQRGEGACRSQWARQLSASGRGGGGGRGHQRTPAWMRAVAWPPGTVHATGSILWLRRSAPPTCLPRRRLRGSDSWQGWRRAHSAVHGIRRCGSAAVLCQRWLGRRGHAVSTLAAATSDRLLSCRQHAHAHARRAGVQVVLVREVVSSAATPAATSAATAAASSAATTARTAR